MSKFIRCIFVIFLILSCCVFSASHTVVKGDTLYSISRKYNISVDELCSENKMSKNDSIYIGQVLSIPEKITKTETYVVKKGDTFYKISRLYGISVEKLLELNKLKSSATLKIGQKLNVPSSIAKQSKEKESNNASLELTDPRNYSTKKGDSSLQWPVKSPEIIYVTGKISGVKLTANKNEDVTAIRAGTVVFSGVYRGFGKVVFVQSQTGHTYVYTGLKEIKDKKIDYVVFGDKLGTVGIDALSGKPQLTLMVYQNGKPIDPAKAPRG